MKEIERYIVDKMGNKVKIAKEIAEIFDVEWRANFVATGSTITTAWFENITMRLNDTKILEQDIDFNIYIEGKSKIRKAKKIAENAGFECRDEWFKPSKPDSKSDGGSTVKIPYFETFLLWSKNNYSDIEAIQDLGVELKENLKDIYEESTNFLMAITFILRTRFSELWIELQLAPVITTHLGVLILIYLK